MNQDYYALLGVSPFATQQEISRAFRRLAFKHHPDRNPTDPSAEEIFKQVNEAYQVLSNLEARGQYDRRRVQKAEPFYRDEAIHFSGIAREYRSQTLAEVGVKTVAMGLKHGSAPLTVLGAVEILFDWWVKSKRG